jgi:hypothetical protein
MKWAVEQRYFDTGAVKVKVRTAKDKEQSRFKEMAAYDLYVDIFDTEDEAHSFAAEAKVA